MINFNEDMSVESLNSSRASSPSKVGTPIKKIRKGSVNSSGGLVPLSNDELEPGSIIEGKDNENARIRRATMDLIDEVLNSRKDRNMDSMLSSNLPFNYDAMLDNLAGEFGEHDVDYLDSDSIISGTQTPTSTYSYAKLKAKINDEVEIKKILKGMDKILELDAILVKKNETAMTLKQERIKRTLDYVSQSSYSYHDDAMSVKTDDYDDNDDCQCSSNSADTMDFGSLQRQQQQLPQRNSSQRSSIVNTSNCISSSAKKKNSSNNTSSSSPITQSSSASTSKLHSRTQSNRSIASSTDSSIHSDLSSIRSFDKKTFLTEAKLKKILESGLEFKNGGGGAIKDGSGSMAPSEYGGREGENNNRRVGGGGGENGSVAGGSVGDYSSEMAAEGNGLGGKLKGYKKGDFLERNKVLGAEARYYDALTEEEKHRVETLLKINDENLTAIAMELNAEGFTISAEEFTHIETIDRSIQDLLSPSQYASRSISLANSGIRTPDTSSLSTKLRDADTVMNDMDTLVTPESLLKEEKRLLKLIDEQLVEMENRAATEDFRPPTRAELERLIREGLEYEEEMQQYGQ